jgi:hypothetical protein
VGSARNDKKTRKLRCLLLQLLYVRIE